MTTQLRLVEQPKRRTSSRNTTARRASTTKTPRARRAAHWGDWQLDPKTRRVGRAGVAAARRALDDARHAHELRQAS